MLSFVKFMRITNWKGRHDISFEALMKIPKNRVIVAVLWAKSSGYGIDDRGVGVRVPVGSSIFSSPLHPVRLWGPPNLISNGYRGLFPRGQNDRLVKLTTHLQLVPRSRKCGFLYIESSTRLHCVVLNYSITEKFTFTWAKNWTQDLSNTNQDFCPRDHDMWYVSAINSNKQRRQKKYFPTNLFRVPVGLLHCICCSKSNGNLSKATHFAIIFIYAIKYFFRRYMYCV
jgi:hypothetical protein